MTERRPRNRRTGCLPSCEASQALDPLRSSVCTGDSIQHGVLSRLVSISSRFSPIRESALDSVQPCATSRGSFRTNEGRMPATAIHAVENTTYVVSLFFPAPETWSDETHLKGVVTSAGAHLLSRSRCDERQQFRDRDNLDARAASVRHLCDRVANAIRLLWQDRH